MLLPAAGDVEPPRVREGASPGELVIDGPGWRDTIVLGAGDEGEMRWRWERREGDRPRRALALRGADLRVDDERLAPAHAPIGAQGHEWVFGERDGESWRVAGGPLAPSSTAS